MESPRIKTIFDTESALREYDGYDHVISQPFTVLPNNPTHLYIVVPNHLIHTVGFHIHRLVGREFVKPEDRIDYSSVFTRYRSALTENRKSTDYKHSKRSRRLGYEEADLTILGKNPYDKSLNQHIVIDTFGHYYLYATKLLLDDSEGREIEWLQQEAPVIVESCSVYV